MTEDDSPVEDLTEEDNSNVVPFPEIPPLVEHSTDDMATIPRSAASPSPSFVSDEYSARSYGYIPDDIKLTGLYNLVKAIRTSIARFYVSHSREFLDASRANDP